MYCKMMEPVPVIRKIYIKTTNELPLNIMKHFPLTKDSCILIDITPNIYFTIELKVV